MNQKRNNGFWLVFVKLLGMDSDEEKRAFDERALPGSAERRLFDAFSDGTDYRRRRAFIEKIDVEQELCRMVKPGRRISSRSLLFWKAAVVVLPLLLGGMAVYQFYGHGDDWSLSSVSQGNVYPGTKKARLVTHDGSVISLDSDSLIMAEYGGAKIKNVGKTLFYVDTTSTSGAIENTLVTPRGGEYAVVLNDGTRVWLNSDSELSYPVVFSGKTREVFLKGEAYFEVAHVSVHPFIVMAEGLCVKVYGTSFNINTRRENMIQATLVEGSVAVKATSRDEVRLHPGEMAVYQKSSGRVTVERVNVEHHVSWKDGEFFFVDEPLEHILDELALWYDVDVFYSRTGLQEMCFTCYVPKYKDIGDVLDLLESTSHVKFKIRERTIIVE